MMKERLLESLKFANYCTLARVEFQVMVGADVPVDNRLEEAQCI